MHVNPRPARVALAGAAAMAFGCFLPWATVLGETFTGTDSSDGRVILAVSAGVATIAVIRLAGRGHWLLDVVAFTGAVAAGVLAGRDLIEISNVHPHIGGIELRGAAAVRVGAGLWISVLGSASAAAASTLLSSVVPTAWAGGRDRPARRA